MYRLMNNKDVDYLQILMNKDDIIKNLASQNQYLQQQITYWKDKYYKLEHQHQQLTHKHHTLSLQLSHSGKQQSSLPEKQRNSLKQIDLIDSLDPSVDSFNSPRLFEQTSLPQQTKSFTKSPKRINTKKAKTQASDNKFDFFQEKIYLPPDKNVCQLIEGCFIIQKNSSIEHFDPLHLLYPQQKYSKLRNMFDIIYRFIFVNDQLIEVRDDQFDSRKNQIIFGTPCQDFQFVLDNVSEKEGEKGRLNDFERESHLLRKRYVYGIVRPEIVQMDKMVYETQIAYGFLSHLPFPNFFKDLNRIVQQQIKYRMLNMNKNTIKKKEKIDIIGEIIQQITTKSLQKQLQVTKYPINLELVASICGLRLVYSNKNNYISDQFSQIESYIHKFNLLKLVKILHYVLTEQSVIIICSNRKKLNQLFQIIRTFIYPFIWIFPIVYYYSPFFQPFLTSPLPILLGHIQHTHHVQGQDPNSYSNIDMPRNQFIQIYAEDEQAKDVNQIASYNKSIDRCYRWMAKGSKSPPKPQKALNHLTQKQQDKLSSKFFTYVKRLRNFIQTGKIDTELDPFLIQFIQTQMVSYYKENLQTLKSSHK